MTLIMNLQDLKQENGNKLYGNNPTIKFDTNVIKPNPCDYSDAYILVTGDIAVVNGNLNTSIAFKKCSPFT